jgi:hypothetical protein
MKMMNNKKSLVSTVVIILMASMIVPLVNAADTGQISPLQAAAIGGGSNAWSNPANAKENDIYFASVTSPGKEIQFSGYNFGILSAISIDGIVVDLDAWKVGTRSQQLSVKLSGDGGATWTSAKVATLTTDTTARISLGSQTDDWIDAGTWILDQLTSSKFIVSVIDTQSGAGTATSWNLDWIPVTVYYTDDSTPPTTSIGFDGTVGTNGWFKTDVTVTLSASDNTGGSGVASTWYRVGTIGSYVQYSAPFTIDSEGQKTVYFYSVDAAGNSEVAQSQVIKIDKSLPTLTMDLTGTAGNAGWFISDVSVKLTGNDAISGISSIEYNLNNAATWTTYSAEFTISNEAQNSLQHKVTDNAGWEYVLSADTIKIDKTAPIVNHDTVPNIVVLNQVVNIDWEATDSISGVSGADSGTITLETSSVGTHNIVIPAVTDNAGNTQSSITISYIVKYNFGGFLSPLKEAGTYKAGSTIPVKFQLIDVNGVSVTDATATIYLMKKEGPSTPTNDEIIDTGAVQPTGGTIFRYVPEDDQYIFNLKTLKTQTGAYYIVAWFAEGYFEYIQINLK